MNNHLTRRMKEMDRDRWRKEYFLATQHEFTAARVREWNQELPRRLGLIPPFRVLRYVFDPNSASQLVASEDQDEGVSQAIMEVRTKEPSE